MNRDTLKLANTLKFQIDTLTNEITKLKNIHGITAVCFYNVYSDDIDDNLFRFEKDFLNDLEPDDIKQFLLNKYEAKLSKLEQKLDKL